jgi:hypothetical protein
MPNNINLEVCTVPDLQGNTVMIVTQPAYENYVQEIHIQVPYSDPSLHSFFSDYNYLSRY